MHGLVRCSGSGGLKPPLETKCGVQANKYNVHVDAVRKQNGTVQVKLFVCVTADHVKKQAFKRGNQIQIHYLYLLGRR